MPPYQEFEERLTCLFALELRRQGVPDVDEWADRLHTYSSFIPSASTDLGAPVPSTAASSSSSSVRHGKTHAAMVFVMDLSNILLGDRPAVALCEALLKTDPPHAKRRVRSVVEWHLRWRHCGLTDRVVHHLELLITGCPKLTVIDVSANAFSEDGKAALLHAAAEVPCDVVVMDEHEDSVTATTTTTGSHSPPLQDVSPPASPVLNVAAAWKEEDAQKRQGPPLHAPRTQASLHELPAGIVDTRSPLFPAAHAAPPSSSSLLFSQRRLQRSPSLTTTTASLSHSQRSYASGSAEALQRRREELFGPTSAAAAAGGLSSSPPAAQHESPKPKEEGDEETATAKHAASSPLLRPTSAAASPPLASSSSPPPVPPPPPPPASEEVGSHSPFRTTAATVPQSPAEGSGRRCPAAPAQAQTDPPENPTQTHSHNSHKNRVIRGGSDDSARAAPSREPFVDRNDQLDVTANLNPVLDSVLDLSALTTREGTLRQIRMFGGARTVWDVLDAYEEAAEQQQQSTTEGEDGVAPALRAKLPAALLGGTTYSAITVLNLSRNHLTSLCALPATLLRLDVSSNALVELDGLQPCKMLTVLNARRNHLREIRGLEKNLGIAHLFLGHNELSLIEGLAHLVLLETLDVTFNQLRTQASLRMLSLCSALRHLLVRGNPLMDSAKPGFIAVLRNLCPTLLVVDEQRVGCATLADRALQHRTWGQPPNVISNNRKSNNSSSGEAAAGLFTRSNSSGGGGGAATAAAVGALSASSTLAHAAVNARSGRRGSAEASIAGSSSLPFTSSRHRRGPPPFAAENSSNDGGTGADGNALDLLHLLTRGVTAPTGYGDTANTQRTAQYFARVQAAAAAKAKAAQAHELTAQGRPLRRTVVQHLAEESRRYVEDTLVRRLTNAAPPNPPNPNSRAGSAERQSTAAGGVDSPARSTSPAVSVAAAAVSTAAVDPATAEVLRRYELRKKPTRGGAAATGAAGRVPKVATTHAAQLRAASARRSMSGSPARASSPASAGTTTAAAAGMDEAAATPHDLGGPRAASARQPSPQQLPQDRNKVTALLPSNPRSDVDATLDAMYVEDTRGGRAIVHEVRPPTSTAKPNPDAATAAAGMGMVNSYAALHRAETAGVLADAEIECSPISKDPQARLVTSLNTTTASAYERSDHHREPPTPKQPPQQQQTRASSAGRAANAYHVPPALSTTKAAPAAATTPATGKRTSPPAASVSPRGPMTKPVVAAAGHHDPTTVEETAIYPGSRSHSRASRGGLIEASAAGPRSQHPSRPATSTTTAAAAAPTTATTTAPAVVDRRSPSAAASRRSRSRSDSNTITNNGDVPPARDGRSHSPSLQPLHIDATQRRRVRDWAGQLSDDAGAVQETLQTLVELLEAQRQPGQPFPESSRELPSTYLQERRRCVEIIEGSGMLADTQVPMEAVVYYGLSKAELDGEGDRSAEVVSRENKSEAAWLREVEERSEVLRLVHLLGDAKTCLRYVSLLVGDGREKLLQQYVDQLKESLRS